MINLVAAITIQRSGMNYMLTRTFLHLRPKGRGVFESDPDEFSLKAWGPKWRRLKPKEKHAVTVTVTGYRVFAVPGGSLTLTDEPSDNTPKTVLPGDRVIISQSFR